LLSDSLYEAPTGETGIVLYCRPIMPPEIEDSDVRIEDLSVSRNHAVASVRSRS
jgi:hypothetical protein